MRNKQRGTEIPRCTQTMTIIFKMLLYTKGEWWPPLQQGYKVSYIITELGQLPFGFIANMS